MGIRGQKPLGKIVSQMTEETGSLWDYSERGCYSLLNQLTHTQNRFFFPTCPLFQDTKFSAGVISYGNAEQSLWVV